MLLPEPLTSRTQFHNLPSFQNNPHIIIIMGIRRCGKSTFLQEIRASSQDSHYYINFDDDRLANFQLEDFQKLLEVFIELFGEQKIFYFDEIQNIPEWERFVRRLHDQGNKIFITGSNASLLSQELGSRLTGRYIPVTLYPFSFREFIAWKHADSLLVKEPNTVERSKIKGLFSEFITLGGFPEFLQYRQPQYFHSLYESIIYRDIMARYGANEKTLKSLVYYLVSQAGKEFSFNSLKKIVGVASASTISDYCGYIENSFLCFFVSRYDYSLKKQLHYAKKIYCVDQALAKAIGFRCSEDKGRLLENIVLIELLRRGNEVYFHKDKKECDFVVKSGQKIIAAIQVTTHLDSDKTRKREKEGLIEAMERYALSEGLILTENEKGQETIKINGKPRLIQILPIWQFLTQTASG